MKVLLSAYACAPHAGSEIGKGWNFAIELARQVEEVVVLTCGSHHKQAIEEFLKRNDLPKNLSFLWHDVPGWPGPGYVNTRHIRKHYFAWQFTAPRTVQNAFGKDYFDVVHHLTWTVLRWPSFLGKFGRRFVFGPVGGGQSAPIRLRSGFPRRGLVSEVLRDTMNLWSKFDPLIYKSTKSAGTILVTDNSTLNYVPRRFRKKTFVVADIYSEADDNHLLDLSWGRSNTGKSILFVGRLEYWKGVHLAIGALEALNRRMNGSAHLTIVGTGPDEAFFRGVASDLKLEDWVTFTGAVPHAQMPDIYSTHDVLLFPSLHDSGPHAIGEALAYGLPVVCLDLGGPGIAVDESCGAVVGTAGRSRSSVEFALADAVHRILTDTEDLDRLRHGARRRAEMFTYQNRVKDMVHRFYAS